MKARIEHVLQSDVKNGYNKGDVINVEKTGYFYTDDKGNIWHVEDIELIEHQPTDTHYNNENGSLYLFAEQHGLNAWEFDILKRITRCRKKGQFIEDLEKTKRVIDLYIKEYDTTANR